MYGGHSSQLNGNIVNTITQISDGLGESLSIDVKTMFAAVLGPNMGKETELTVNNGSGEDVTEYNTLQIQRMI